MIPYAPRNWLRLLLASRGSLSPGVPRRVLAFGLIAAVAVALDRLGAAAHPPIGLHEIGGGVIALILAFRTNTAYARFWEGRTLWGSMVNASRNVTRIVRAHARVDPAAQDEFAAWVALFAHATRHRLRGTSARDEAARLLGDAAEVEAFGTAPHPALHAAAQLSRRLQGALAAGAIDPILAGRAERQVATLVDNLGACERIRNTPTPLGLVLLMERFVAVYLASLPFALVARAGLLTPLFTMAVAYPVLMIDALGAELDDPFGQHPNDLPLTRLCKTIERDVTGRDPDAAQPAPAEDVVT